MKTNISSFKLIYLITAVQKSAAKRDPNHVHLCGHGKMVVLVLVVDEMGFLTDPLSGATFCTSCDFYLYFGDTVFFALADHSV